jgi:hypothetical protein
MFVMYFSCETCRENTGFPRGHVSKVAAWACNHVGHDAHVNLLGVSGVTVTEWLASENKKYADEERNQKIIKAITFGLFGETSEDRRKKYLRSRWHNMEPRTAGPEDEN